MRLKSQLCRSEDLAGSILRHERAGKRQHETFGPQRTPDAHPLPQWSAIATVALAESIDRIAGKSYDGRVRIQTPAASMTAPAATEIPTGAPPDQSKSQLADMLTPARALALRGMARRSSHAASGRPRWGWARSQASRLGELRANAHAAISRKGVVGSTGRRTPAKAMPTAAIPRSRNVQAVARPASEGEQ